MGSLIKEFIGESSSQREFPRIQVALPASPGFPSGVAGGTSTGSESGPGTCSGRGQGTPRLFRNWRGDPRRYYIRLRGLRWCRGRRRARLGGGWRWLLQVCALHVLQPSRSARRTASVGQSSFALITRTRDPSECVTSACEQMSSSMSATSSSVAGNHCNVLDTSPGQIRHVEPSLSSTMWLLSCCLIRIGRRGRYGRRRRAIHRRGWRAGRTVGRRGALRNGGTDHRPLRAVVIISFLNIVESPLGPFGKADSPHGSDNARARTMFRA